MIVTDAGAFGGAVLLVAVGIAAAYRRLRREFDPVISALTVIILAGATPLSLTVVRGDVIDAGLFAGLALFTYVAVTRIPGTLIRSAALLGSVLALPFVAPTANPAPTLFAPSNGFLALTPMVYVAVIGAAAAWRRHREETAAAFVSLALWPALHVSLVPALAFLLPGLAAALAWARARPIAAVTPVVAFVIVWNYWLMVQYTTGTIPKDAPVSFAAMVRQQAEVHTRAPYVYPFAVPGNLVAAWREGVPLPRYDALSAEPRREHFEVRFDRAADRFLLHGWGAAGSNAAGSYRTVGGGDAVMIFPLRPEPRAIDIALLTASRNEGAGSYVRMTINGEAIGTIHAQPGSPSESRVRVSAADVGRIFRAGYNHFSIVPLGSARIAIYRLRISPAA